MYMQQRTGSFKEEFSKNTFYRLSSAVASSLLSPLATTCSVLFPVLVIIPVSCCPHAVNEHTITTMIIKNNLFFISFFLLSFYIIIRSMMYNCPSLYSAVMSPPILSVSTLMKTLLKHLYNSCNLHNYNLWHHSTEHHIKPYLTHML